MILTGTPASRKTPMFWAYGRSDITFSYSKGRDRSPDLAVRQDKWKHLTNDDGTRTELYIMATDCSENTDVAAQQLRVVNKMKTKLLAWRKKLPELSAQQESRR